MAPTDCELCAVEANQRSTEIMVHSTVCTLVVIGLVIFNTVGLRMAFAIATMKCFRAFQYVFALTINVFKSLKVVFFLRCSLV